MKLRLLLPIIFLFFLVGCGSELESKFIVDYRYNEPRTDVVTDYSYKYNWREDEYQLVPDTHTKYVPESYELMYEYRYSNGHVSRGWETCTRYEYETAKEELGDTNDEN